MPRNGVPGAHTEQVSAAKPRQADMLIRLAEASDLYHTPDDTAFADLAINGHRETWAIRSSGFRRWLTRRFYEATDGAPNAEAMQSALAIIEAKAHFDGGERPVHVRTAGLDDKLYLDLADAGWRAVEINADGWRVTGAPPVRFRRARGMLPLPVPVSGGKLTELRGLVNVRDDRDMVLIVAWLLAALRDRGPYPLLALSGEQGSAKSVLAAMLRALVDPNTVALRAPPRDDRDLYIAATNGHVIVLDNLSSLPAWLSDALCRLSTGGGFATRQLYKDTDEVLLEAMRPIILTAIEDVATRGDLADRAMRAILDPIADDRRRPEREIWVQFEAARPRILGVLLDAVAHGLRHLATTRLDRLPRMADFALWVTACETALWNAGKFISAYDANRAEMDKTVIEDDGVATAVLSLMVARQSWNGTAQILLPLLVDNAGDAAKAKTWPVTPRALSGRLRRVAPSLRRVGISVAFGKRQAAGRPITIYQNREAFDRHNRHDRHDPGDSAASGDDGRMIDDGTTVRTVIPTVTPNPREFAADDGHDGDDGDMLPDSASDREPAEWTL
jgi:hypothetical protein